MRTFFAIEFEDAVKDYLFDIQQELRQYCSRGNYSHKENFHLTLRFMGEQNQNEVERLKAALMKTAGDMKEFELKLGKLGSFNKGNKKIIWLGLYKSPELQTLYSRLENELLKNGYEREDRSYSPHITLLRETRVDNFSTVADRIKINELSIQVKAISLMESTRIDNRLTYLAIDRCSLNP